MKKSDLIHYKIQAAMREWCFPESELLYLGVKNGEHTYLVGGQHEVPVTDITEFVNEDEEVND